MSVDYYMVGVIDKSNEVYKKHYNVYKACLEAGIKELPKETAIFFNSWLVDMVSLDEKVDISIPQCDYLSEDFKKADINDNCIAFIDVKDIPNGCHRIELRWA